MQNNAISITGLWDEGFVLDQYNKTSIYKGEDVFGHPCFENTYTEIGDLLHAMKYNGHYDTSNQIAEICVKTLGSWIKSINIDAVLPVPPTNVRNAQPVFMIADKIARLLNIPYSEEILLKTSEEQAKNMPKENKNLKGTIVQQRSAIRTCNILLVDDIYSTGETANECVSVLKKDPLIQKVYFVAIAKTK